MSEANSRFYSYMGIYYSIKDHQPHFTALDFWIDFVYFLCLLVFLFSFDTKNEIKIILFIILSYNINKFLVFSTVYFQRNCIKIYGKINIIDTALEKFMGRFLLTFCQQPGRCPTEKSKWCTHGNCFSMLIAIVVDIV